MLILWPWPNRYPELLRDDVLKPRLLHPLFQLTPRIGVLTKVLARLQQRVHPHTDSHVRLHRPVLGVVFEMEILELGIPAWLGVVEGLTHEFGPVGDGASHVADVDKVEGGLEGPEGFGVVDFEFDVFGDPNRIWSALDQRPT